MANEKRLRVNSIGGLIEDNPLTNVATALNSAALAAVPLVDTTNYLPIVIDPDGIEGAPEIAYVTAHVVAATSGTLLRGQEGTAAIHRSQGIPWVHAPTVKDYDGAGGGSGLIGLTNYNPGTAAYTGTTSATPSDIDATNLKIDFIVPPSGKILFRLTARFSVNAATDLLWNLREGTSDIAGSSAIIHYASAGYVGSRASSPCLVTGLTPGAAKTYKWGHARGSGGTCETGYGGTAGPAVMEAWAVNF